MKRCKRQEGGNRIRGDYRQEIESKEYEMSNRNAKQSSKIERKDE